MRRKANGLVPNEEIVLVAALALNAAVTPFHGYALHQYWSDSGESKMSYATLYRCLDRLEDRGLLKSAPGEPEEPGVPARRMFSLTGEGAKSAVELEAGQPNGGGVPRLA